MPRATASTSQATPLWIISIFIGLSEVVAGLVATQGSGWIAGALAVFAVVYPVGVTSLFFYVLLRRNWLFYPPSEFSDQVQPAAYIEAMAKGNRTQFRRYGLAVEAAVAKGVVSVTTAAAGGEDLADHVQRATDVAKRELENRFIEVDVSAFDEKFAGAPLHYIPEETDTVTDFLNFVWFTLRDFVNPYQYLVQWVLVDEADRTLDKIGTRWARGQGWDDDVRLLTAVGIKPGDRLRVRKLL